MPIVGVYGRELLTRYKNCTVARTMAAATDGDQDPLIAGRAGYTIYVTRIIVHVTTAAAQTWTFQDNATTPIVLAVLPASAAVGPAHLLLDAPEGVPCTEGKDLDLVVSAAGVAGHYYVEAYLRPTGVMEPSGI